MSQKAQKHLRCYFGALKSILKVDFSIRSHEVNDVCQSMAEVDNQSPETFGINVEHESQRSENNNCPKPIVHI